MGERKRIGVLGTMGNVPYAGMAWMHGQFLMGLARMGHDVFYVETTTAWPYHPLNLTTSDDPTYTIEYLDKVMLVVLVIFQIVMVLVEVVVVQVLLVLMVLVLVEVMVV